jgi:uncharacterized glyoxalase superfamily protein PhnB
MNDTTPSPQVWPTLRARDARSLIRFLVDVVGFEETVAYGDGDRVDHCELSWPLGGGIMLGSTRGSEDDQCGLTPGTFGAYVVADDIDDLHARAARGRGRRHRQASRHGLRLPGLRPSRS